MTNKLNIHFIGIGGIGVSALAKYYLEKGHYITGSDLACSEITGVLKKSGVKIFIGSHSVKNLPKNTDLVIYSPAVTEKNPELKKAKKLKIKTQSYPQALGDLTKKYFTIAVSGTHGKSTTASMLGLTLIKAGLDPTVIVGTKLKEFKNSNCRVGKSKYLVIEADEHFGSFLNYWPKIIVLTNIEADHLDYYKNLNNILKSFKKYISHLGKDGFLVMNKDDKNISKIAGTNIKNQKYTLKQKEARIVKKILKVPGEHNVSNALAVLTTARILKIPDKITLKTLSEYKGAWRRFEIKKGRTNNKNFTIISDYGHHPTEVKATLKAVREKFPKKEIWCIFQPHQFQRTFYLFNDFVNVFNKAIRQKTADKIILTDIYTVAGREKKEIKKKVNSKKLVEAVNNPKVIYIAKNKIENYLRKNLKSGQIIVFMGAGDIYKLAQAYEIKVFHLTRLTLNNKKQ